MVRAGGDALLYWSRSFLPEQGGTGARRYSVVFRKKDTERRGAICDGSRVVTRLERPWLRKVARDFYLRKTKFTYKEKRA